MGPKENYFTQQPVGMSPMKQQHIKAKRKDTRLLHRKEIRRKKETCPCKATKIKSVSLFSPKLNQTLKKLR